MFIHSILHTFFCSLFPTCSAATEEFCYPAHLSITTWWSVKAQKILTTEGKRTETYFKTVHNSIFGCLPSPQFHLWLSPNLLFINFIQLTLWCLALSSHCFGFMSQINKLSFSWTFEKRMDTYSYEFCDIFLMPLWNYFFSPLRYKGKAI